MYQKRSASADGADLLTKPLLLSPAGSKCSTAAPPTPASTCGLPPLDAQWLGWLEDEDDDEIMKGVPRVRPRVRHPASWKRGPALGAQSERALWGVSNRRVRADS